MTDEPKPEIDMKEEQAKTKKIVETPKKIEESKKMTPEQEKKIEQLEKSTKETPKTEEKKEDKKPAQKPKIKKTEAIVKRINLPISTKYSAAICKFIKNKKIPEAISILEKVLKQKIAVPVKGEIPHKKGIGKFASGSGKYPKKITEHFIKLLKSLQANADYNEIEEPVIIEATANIGSRPYGRFGRIRKKRSHIQIIAKEKKELNKSKKKNGRKKSSSV